MAIDNSGKIVVAGYSLNIFAVARYNADGTLDAGFSSDGKLTTRIGASTVDLAYAVAVQSDNKIVVAGSTNSDAALVRYNNDGSLDTTFDSDGKVTTVRSTFSTSTQHVGFNSIVIQSDRKIVAAGSNFAGFDQDFVLARYTSSGALDNTFGSSGTVVTDFGNTEDYAHSVALQSGGKIVVAGVAGSGSGGQQVQVGNGNFALARYTSSGQLDPGFGSGGKVITDFGHNDHGRAMAIQPDGNIVVAGFTVRNLYEDFSLARYLGRGAPSKDASLRALAVTQGPSANAVAAAVPFRPITFNQYRTGYTALLAADTTHVKVTPTAGDANATIVVTGGGERQQVINGLSSAAIPVAGFSRIVVDVTAEDGKNRQTYTIDLRPGANEASLTDLKAEYSGQSGSVPLVIGEFHPERTSYSGVMPYSTGSEELNNLPEAVTLIPTWDLTTSTVTVNGEALGGSGFYSDQIPLNVGDNVITVRVTAGDGVTTRDYTLNVRRLAPAVEEWEPELRSRDLGGGRFGCRDGVAGAGCSDSAVLSESRFSVHSGGYGHAETTNYRVREMSVERVNQLGADRQFRVVLTVASSWTVELKNMTLVVDHNGQQYRLPFRRAKRSGLGRTFTWLEWTESSALVWGRGSTPELRIEASRTGLDKVRVYYDEMRGGQPVEGFRRWDIAREKPYDSFYHDDWDDDRAHIAVIPGEFPSLNQAQGKLLTTHVRLRLAGTTPGSRVQYIKGAYNDSPPFFFGFETDLPSSGITEPIELDPASKNTYVWVKVSHGVQGIPGFLEHTLEERVHLVIIDPPPRTYKVNPEVTVTEGDEATVTVSLGNPATRGGVTFEVTAAYGDGGATADDVGEIASTVTVPEGQRSAQIVVPTVDDDAVEDDESFTVSVSHVGTPAWAVEPGKTATATVTIANDDEPPPGPEPWNIVVTPGDGTLTVTWNVSSREGYDDSEVWHALRWFQPYGGPHRWDNPRDRRAVGRNDGLSVDPGVTSYTITGLTNGVATDVFVRSMVGHRNNMSERLADSSKWVKVTGDTTPVAPPNEAPTVAYGIADVTIASENGSGEVSLWGVFADADGDDLTVTAVSSDENVAAVSVSADYGTLTVNANTRGTVTVTVTADDGSGGSVQDSFTVTVKAAPAVVSAIADVGELQIDAAHEVPLSGVFSDPDGDALTISTTSSDNAIATVSATIDPVTGSTTALTVTATGEGTATVTVTARDSDGNSVSDDFDVTVPAPVVQPQQAAQEPEAQQEAAEQLQQAETLPGAVVSLEVTATADGTVTVSWQAPTSGAAPTRYIVHLKPEGGETGSGKTKRPKAPKTQVKYKDLEPGTTYNVWVRAQNKTGKGERTHATITLPSTPQPQ